MNILLIYPTKLDQNNNPIKYKKAYLPPLSLAILNSLTPPKHKVKIVNDIAEEIDFTGSYDLVGITAMTSQIPRAYQLADKFRGLGVKVVIGGIHAKFLPLEVLEHADSIVIGEAENIWEQVLDDAENKRLKQIYQNDTLSDFSRTIIPKWDNFNFKIYPKRFGSKFPLMPVFTARGCPHNCKFCSVTKFFGKKYRVKPIADVLAEIDSIKTDLFFLIDDNIVCDVDYSRELFKALATKKISWFSQISTRVHKYPELLELAAKAGCGSLLVGIESLNNNNLESVKKPFNKIEEYEEFFARLRKAGIVPAPSVIFGLDHDTPQQLRMTVEFLLKNKVGLAIFFLLTPMPGTDLFMEMEQEGRLLHKNWSLYDANHVVYQPKSFSTDELYQTYWQLYQEFYTLKNAAKRTVYNATISRTPVKRFLGDLFLQPFFRRAVNSYEHPFSGGVNRI